MAGEDEDDNEPSERGSAILDGALNPMEWEGRKPRASTTGTFRPIADQTNWRKHLKENRIKFDDRAKARYLAELERTGIKGAAARAAGVTPETVSRHVREVDPDFGLAVDDALSAYNARIELKITQEAIEGVLVTKSRRVKAPDGSEDWEEEVHREVRFETALRQAILRKVNPDYRENSTLNVQGGMSGGVVLIPVVKDLDEWMRLFGPTDEPSETVE